MTSPASFNSMASPSSLNGSSPKPSGQHRNRSPNDQTFADAAAPAINGKLDMRREPENGDVQVNGTHGNSAQSTDGKTDKSTKKLSSFFGNGFSERAPPPQLTVEKFQDKDGEHLTTINSVASPDDDRPRLERSDTLVSGRRPTNQIRFAPLSLPLHRRLQTLWVLMHTLSIPLFLTAFFLLAALPITWPILLPYLIYLQFSRAPSSGTLSRRSSFARSLPFWELFASYFPMRLHRSEELPPTRKYIFGYHPHGIISHGAFTAFVTEALGFSQLFPGITNTLLTLENNFRIPLYREWALALGIASVSKDSCNNLLSNGGADGEGMGRAITIVIGGAQESLDALPGYFRLVLHKRKGFVKLAITNGADLVPVLAFGENELYDQLDSETHPVIHKWQMVMKKFMGFTVPLFHARGVFNYDVGVLPYRKPVNIVVGRPIRVVRQKVPDPKYVEELHGRYVTELERIWEEWKDEFARGRKEELRIVE